MNEKSLSYFKNLSMLNTIVEIGAGAASRYGSGYIKIMRLFAAPAPHNSFTSFLL
jgi:hypothetical protein